MREEMEFHLESRIATLVSRGMTPKEAARTARIEFGSAEARRDECREVLGYRPWDELRADLRFAARGAAQPSGLFRDRRRDSGGRHRRQQRVLHPLLAPRPQAAAHTGRGAALRSHRPGSPRSSPPLAGRRWRSRRCAQASRQQVEGLYSCRTIQMLVLEPVQRLGLISFVSGNYFRLLSGAAGGGARFSRSGAKRSR